MTPHTKTYMDFFGLGEQSFVGCEVCGNRAADIHHIIPRSKFGNKRKDEQDSIYNLIALCRFCHDQAHAERYTKDFLTDIHLRTIKKQTL